VITEHRSSSPACDHHRGRRAAGHSIAGYPDDGGTRPWPYELRFYDPPVDGFVATLRLPVPDFLGSTFSDYTMRLEQVPGFKPRPADLARSPAHNSGIVVVGRSLKP
jgi:hypothetical protein